MNRGTLQSLNSQLTTSQCNLQSKLSYFRSVCTDLIQVKLKADGGRGGGRGEGQERGTHSRGQVPGGDNGRDTVPLRQAAAFRGPRGAGWSQAGPVGQALSSLQSPRERRCRPWTPRGSRQRPRGATDAGPNARPSSEPSGRGHPARLSAPQTFLLAGTPAVQRCLLTSPSPRLQKPDVGTPGSPSSNFVKKKKKKGE